MELHPLHRLYLGLGHGEAGARPSHAATDGSAAAAPVQPASTTSAAGGALRAAVVGLVALAVAGRLIGKVTGGR